MEGNSVVTPFGLHSGLRQSGTHSSQKRDEWGTRHENFTIQLELWTPKDGTWLISWGEMGTEPLRIREFIGVSVSVAVTVDDFDATYYLAFWQLVN